MMNTSAHWRQALLGGITLLILGACAGQRTELVLMPEPDGSVGMVEIVNAAGSQMLDTAGQSVRVNGQDKPPDAPRIMHASEIEKLFGQALRVLPPLPEQFLFYFINNTVRLSDVSRRQLNGIISAIKRHPSPEVSAVGHTDRKGTDQFNYQLGLERAKIIRDILIEEGIPPEMVQVVSHGETNPAVATPDEISEPRNRRVEVFVR